MKWQWVFSAAFPRTPFTKERACYRGMLPSRSVGMRNSALRGEEERGRAEDNICVGALQGWLKRNTVGMGTNMVSRCTELLGFIGTKSISSSSSPSFSSNLGLLTTVQLWLLKVWCISVALGWTVQVEELADRINYVPVCSRSPRNSKTQLKIRCSHRTASAWLINPSLLLLQKCYCFCLGTQL